MKPDDELKELGEREARARSTLLKLASEVRPVLAEDLEKYPGREVKRRFLADPEFARTLDDAALGRLKSELAGVGERLREQVAARLDDPEPWLKGVEFEGPGKSFSENLALWSLTLPAAEAVRKVLDAFGFPGTAESPPDYRMPTWFINGKYLPGLAEKYWSLIGELREVRARILEVERSRLRDDLSRRWDKL
jgi:hypothetical protein